MFYLKMLSFNIVCSKLISLKKKDNFCIILDTFIWKYILFLVLYHEDLIFIVLFVTMKLYPLIDNKENSGTLYL